MLVISSREFRQNQRLYFDKVDQGEQIIVQRGKDKSYALTPIGEEDIFFNKRMVEQLKQSIQESRNGDYIEASSTEEIRLLLGLCCLLYTSPSPRDRTRSRMPSSA